MKLGTKINLVLVVVTTIVLTVAFWIVVNIEGSNIEKQVRNDSSTIGEILLENITRMFSQMRTQEEHLQSVVDKLSVIEGVKYIDVMDMNGVYIAATNHSLVGTKADTSDSEILERIKVEKKPISTRKDEGVYYELERRIPIYQGDSGETENMINMIEVEVATRSKGPSDVLDAQKLLQVISVSIEQNARSIFATRKEDLDAIQEITDDVTKFDFFHDFIVFDTKLNIIANTGGEKDEFADDESRYQRMREDVIAGNIEHAEDIRIHEEDKEVIFRMEPIKLHVDGKSKIIGLLEIHTLTSAYEDRISALELRMIGIGVIFVAILVITLAIFLRREIIGPIMLYSKVAQKVADGDLNQVIEYSSDDEIGKFGDVFNSMVANLREFDRLKSDFISVAAHQLRTPLSGVKWVLKLLLDGDLGAISTEQKEMLKRGFDTNEKMIQLVNDLLNVSRIENGKFGYAFEKNDFSKLLKTLVENSELAARARGIEILVEDRAQVGEFMFDAEKLLIAFQNIVDNAVKYTLPGGRVFISVEKQGDYVQVKIKDTGVGIPKSELHKLFSKFFRATNVIHLQTDGSGLGLFIVKSIILRHGGQVWVDSVEGKGTTFTVIVPIVNNLVPTEVSIQGSEASKK
jgi:signal transduction histidine kinase